MAPLVSLFTEFDCSIFDELKFSIFLHFVQLMLLAVVEHWHPRPSDSGTNCICRQCV